MNNAVFIYFPIPFGIFMLFFAVMSLAFLSGTRLDEEGFRPIIKILIKVILGAFTIMVAITSIPVIINGVMLLEKNIGLINLPIIKGFTITIGIITVIVAIIVIYCYSDDGLVGIFKSLPLIIGVIISYPAIFFFFYFTILFFINLFKYSLKGL